MPKQKAQSVSGGLLEIGIGGLLVLLLMMAVIKFTDVERELAPLAPNAQEVLE